jgi:hypothetical protein
MHTDIPKAFTRELALFRLPARPLPGPVVTEQALADLPPVVARYLRFMGVVGQPRHASFRMAVEGRFRRTPTEAWMPAEAWQYNTRTPIARIFRMRIRMAGFLPIVGHDTYADGHGRLVAGRARPVAVLRLLFLQVARVGEQQPAQRGGGRSTPDGPPKALPGEHRQVARMIDVGVGEHHRVDGGGLDGEALPVALSVAPRNVSFT